MYSVFASRTLYQAVASKLNSTHLKCFKSQRRKLHNDMILKAFLVFFSVNTKWEVLLREAKRNQTVDDLSQLR